MDPHNVKKKLELKQEKAKHCFDWQAKSLPVLETGDLIRVRMGNSWKPGLVMQPAETPRSYKTQTDEGGKYLRNRIMLIKSPECNSSLLDSPVALDSSVAGAYKRSPSKIPIDEPNPLVEEPASMLPQPEELSSTCDDIEEPTRTTSGYM